MPPSPDVEVAARLRPSGDHAGGSAKKPPGLVEVQMLFPWMVETTSDDPER
jgi:hypothetical protein